MWVRWEAKCAGSSVSTDLDLPGSIIRIVVHDWAVDGTRITHLRDLVAAGATYPEAHQVVAEMDRLTRGAYADTSGLSAEDVHLLRAAAQLRRLDGVVASHISAAAIWQLPLRESDLGTVHLSPRSGRRGKPKAGSGYRLHTRTVGTGEARSVDGILTTDPVRTVVDCARLLRGDWGVVVADAAFQRGLVGPDELLRQATRVRRLHGAARARALPDLCSPRSESPGESLLRLRLRRMGLGPAEQVSMPWVQGHPRVDFLIDEWLVIEFDGRTKYSLDGDPERAHWEEKRRHDRLVEAGYDVIHVVWAELWDEPALRRRINRAMRRSGRRGTPHPVRPPALR